MYFALCSSANAFEFKRDIQKSVVRPLEGKCHLNAEHFNFDNNYFAAIVSLILALSLLLLPIGDFPTSQNKERQIEVS